jgi:hypothetical protein
MSVTTYRLTQHNISEGLNLKSKVSGNKTFTNLFGRDKLRDSYRSPAIVTVNTVGRSCTADGKDKECTYVQKSGVEWYWEAPAEKIKQYDRTHKTTKETA